MKPKIKAWEKSYRSDRCLKKDSRLNICIKKDKILVNTEFIKNC